MTKLMRVKLSVLLLYLVLPCNCLIAVNLQEKQRHVCIDFNKLKPKHETKKHNLYFRASLGKTSSHNSQKIVNSIKSLLNQATENENWFVGVIFKFLSSQVNGYHPKADFEWIGSASAGFYIGNNGKFELEIAHSQGTMENEQTISTYTIIPNLYYSPNIKNIPIIPHAGIGIGLIGIRLASYNPPLNFPWIVYQMKLGISYRLKSNVKSSLEYRCFNTPIPLVGRVTNHNIELGLSFDF